MNTLLEFVTFTKGTSYLIAIAFLFCFLAFWQVVHHGRRGKGLLVRIVPVALMALGLVALVSLLVARNGVASAAAPGAEMPFLNSEVLVEMYAPASFDHELHQGIVEGCTVCHHNSGEATPACNECHGAAFDPEDLNKPGVAHVYHLRCIGCHRENGMSITECTGCHTQASIPPPSAAHSLTGVEDCLSCHGAGVYGAAVVPADHDGATSGVCQLCHEPTAEATALETDGLPH